MSIETWGFSFWGEPLLISSRDMKRSMEMLAAAGLAATIGAGNAEAKSPDTADAGQESQQGIEGSGMYANGDQATKEILSKVESGEWQFVQDETPASVQVIGDRAAVAKVVKEQGLTVTTTGIYAETDTQSNEWNVKLVDKDGGLLVESQLVQLSVSGDDLVVLVMNSDGSMDRMVYDDGAVKSSEHLILTQVK